jgi:hypothetical protein
MSISNTNLPSKACQKCCIVHFLKMTYDIMLELESLFSHRYVDEIEWTINFFIPIRPKLRYASKLYDKVYNTTNGQVCNLLGCGLSNNGLVCTSSFVVKQVFWLHEQSPHLDMSRR